MSSTLPEAQIMNEKCIEFILMFGIMLIFKKCNYHFQ